MSKLSISDNVAPPIRGLNELMNTRYGTHYQGTVYIFRHGREHREIEKRVGPLAIVIP